MSGVTGATIVLAGAFTGNRSRRLGAALRSSARTSLWARAPDAHHPLTNAIDAAVILVFIANFLSCNRRSGTGVTARTPYNNEIRLPVGRLNARPESVQAPGGTREA